MLKGNMTISRPTYGCGKEKILITLKDKKSRTRFIEVEIGYTEFTQILTGLSEVEVDFSVKGLESVGKTKVVTRRKELVPECYTPYYCHIEEISEWLQDLYGDGTTFVNTYLGSKDSFTTKDGETYVNFSTYVYEE